MMQLYGNNQIFLFIAFAGLSKLTPLNLITRKQKYKAL
jgi:hypothetical protein